MKRQSKQLALSVQTVRDLSAGLAQVTGGGHGSKRCITAPTGCVGDLCTTTTPTLTV